MKILYFILIVSVAAHTITVPTGRFTFKFSILDEQNFYLKYGDFNFTLTNSSFVNNNNNQNLKESTLKSYTHKTILWLSVNLIERKNLTNNFIKFGHDYVILNNTLCEFNPIDFDTINSLRFVSKLEFESAIKLKIETSSLIKDPSIKIFGQNRQLIDESDIPMTKQTLPDRLKTIYEIIKNRSPVLDDDEISAIKFSMDTPSCFLHSKKTIKIIFKHQSFNFDSQPYFLRIWPKASQSLIHDHSNFYGVYKVIEGDMLIEVYNGVNETQVVKSTVLAREDIGWFSPDLYQTFKIKNLNPTRPLVVLYSYVNESVVLDESTFEYENNEREQMEVEIDYNEFKNVVLYEYYTRTCKRNVFNCCEYSGLVCGWKLLRNSNCSNLYENEGLYLCDMKENTVKFIDKCEKYCNQDQLATRCMSKLYAQANYQGFGVLNFVQFPEHLKIWGKLENLTQQSSEFSLRVYTGSNCENREDIFKPSLIRDIQDLRIQSDDKGVLNVNFEINNLNFNIMENNEYTILDRVLVLEDHQGISVGCTVVLKSDKIYEPVDEPESTTPVIETTTSIKSKL